MLNYRNETLKNYSALFIKHALAIHLNCEVKDILSIDEWAHTYNIKYCEDDSKIKVRLVSKRKVNNIIIALRVKELSMEKVKDISRLFHKSCSAQLNHKVEVIKPIYVPQVKTWVSVWLDGHVLDCRMVIVNGSQVVSKVYAGRSISSFFIPTEYGLQEVSMEDLKGNYHLEPVSAYGVSDWL